MKFWVKEIGPQAVHQGPWTGFIGAHVSGFFSSSHLKMENDRIDCAQMSAKNMVLSLMGKTWKSMINFGGV